jgi:hypothetical protein
VESDDLYGLPLDEFVRERNALARSLRKEGRREEADAVAKLAKPTAVAALVNRLARERPVDLRRFLRAADELRAAQAGGRGDFAEAARAEREALQALVRRARELGDGASEQTLDRVARTLRAAAGDDEARPLLERGVLTREVEPTGFASVLGAMPATPPARPREPKRDPAEGRERARAERELTRLRARAAELERAAEAAERAATEARRRADEVAKELAAAEKRSGSS